MAKPYDCWLGPMDYQWKNPPPPFNPDFDPKAKARYATVTASLEKDNFYATHSSAECKAEWQRRYQALKENQ